MSQRGTNVKPHFPSWLLAGIVPAACFNMACGAAQPAPVPGPSRSSAVDFKRDIEPIFAGHCHKCHGPEKQKNGLRLDRKADAFKGGDSGRAFVPGQSAESRLYKYIAGLDPEIVMPPRQGGGERLATNQVALIKTWIDAGAPWPEELSTINSQPSTRDHWSFIPPRRPPVPQIRNPQSAIRNPIDAFIAAEHQARGLAPSPEASKRVLIRRLTLDLTGLPPAPADVERFLADNSRDAYERLVDRLLASPQYGERWGRHWLDLARWAETEGYEKNTFRASVWRYRDYVVNSFNQDKTYDRFLRQQIAGDEMVPYSDENLIATAFLSGARYSNNEEDKAVQRNDVLVDIANMTAGVTLGLTLSCAQCHDHKFDPLTIRDYYRWHGYFVRGQLVYLLLQDTNLWKQYQSSLPPEYEASKNLRHLIWQPARERLVEEARRKFSPETLAALNLPDARRTAEQDELAKRAAQELNVSKEAIEKFLSEEDRKLVQELDKKIARLETELREKKPQVWGFYSPASSPHALDMLSPKGDYPLPYEPEKLRKTIPVLYKRGDVHRTGDELEPGWPEVLVPAAREIRSESRLQAATRAQPLVQLNSSPGSPAKAGTPNRSALVDWLASPANPLTARVLVNFVWQQHFGRGIVETAGDFGVRGAKPTHPELLDWLAFTFMSPSGAAPSRRSAAETDNSQLSLVRRSLGEGGTLNPQPAAGWSIKHLHRLIVLSGTYRQASQPNAANEKLDPANRYLWRWKPRRLEAEVIRDSALSISGQLDTSPGGPSVSPEDVATSLRRTLYLRQSRGHFPVAQSMFDGPTANESCPHRYVSTVPLQPLYLMNSPFMVKRAEAFAARVFANAGDAAAKQIEIAFDLSLGRPPTTSERQAAEALFRSSGAPTPTASETATGSKPDERPPAGLVRLCHSLLNLNEFVYLE